MKNFETPSVAKKETESKPLKSSRDIAMEKANNMLGKDNNETDTKPLRSSKDIAMERADEMLKNDKNENAIDSQWKDKKVKVIRTSGAEENDWNFEGHAGDIVMVSKGEGEERLTKMIPREEFLYLNDEKFKQEKDGRDLRRKLELIEISKKEMARMDKFGGENVRNEYMRIFRELKNKGVDIDNDDIYKPGHEFSAFGDYDNPTVRNFLDSTEGEFQFNLRFEFLEKIRNEAKESVKMEKYAESKKSEDEQKIKKIREKISSEPEKFEQKKELRKYQTNLIKTKDSEIILPKS